MQNTLFPGPACTWSRITICARPACVQGTLMRRGRAAGVGATPWVQGGGAWHRGWEETVGRPASGGSQLGSVRARGRVSGRAARCLPEVRSRACVDAWTGAASCGSFRAVALVAVWGLGLPLRKSLVNYRNAPDNAYSQGCQELNIPVVPVEPARLPTFRDRPLPAPPRTFLCDPRCPPPCSSHASIYKGSESPKYNFTYHFHSHNCPNRTIVD